MTDKCQYPHCRAPLVSFLHRGEKIVGLCDQHLDHLLSEHRKITMAAEKVLKIPAIETGARMASYEEQNIFCCSPGCNYPASLFYGNKPVCSEHAKTHEYTPFDGTYRKRKIIVVERPVASKDAVVVKGSGTGNEKREKNRKIYPVNPTRGIPLPAKEPIDVEDERQQLAEEKESLKKMSKTPNSSAKYYKQVETMKKKEDKMVELTEEEKDMVKAEKLYSKPTKTARAKLGKYRNNPTAEIIDKANRDLEDQALGSFTEAVQEASEDDIHAILARLNNGELEMPED